MTVCASLGRSLAERQLDTPRALSSRWVSARLKVSSSDYCEETMNQIAGGHQRNTQRPDRGMAYRGVPANAVLKYISSATISKTPRDRSSILAQYIGQRESVSNEVYINYCGERSSRWILGV